MTKNEYKNGWIRENLDRVNLTMPKGKKNNVKEIAESNGESLNSFINRAIDAAIENRRFVVIAVINQEILDPAVFYNHEDAYEFMVAQVENKVSEIGTDNIIENIIGDNYAFIASTHDDLHNWKIFSI